MVYAERIGLVGRLFPSVERRAAITRRTPAAQLSFEAKVGIGKFGQTVGGALDKMNRWLVLGGNANDPRLPLTAAAGTGSRIPAAPFKNNILMMQRADSSGDTGETGGRAAGDPPAAAAAPQKSNLLLRALKAITIGTVDGKISIPRTVIKTIGLASILSFIPFAMVGGPAGFLALPIIGGTLGSLCYYLGRSKGAKPATSTATATPEAQTKIKFREAEMNIPTKALNRLVTAEGIFGGIGLAILIHGGVSAGSLISILLFGGAVGWHIMAHRRSARELQAVKEAQALDATIKATLSEPEELPPGAGGNRVFRIIVSGENPDRLKDHANVVYTDARNGDTVDYDVEINSNEIQVCIPADLPADTDIKVMVSSTLLGKEVIKDVKYFQPGAPANAPLSATQLDIKRMSWTRFAIVTNEVLAGRKALPDDEKGLRKISAALVIAQAQLAALELEGELIASELEAQKNIGELLMQIGEKLSPAS